MGELAKKTIERLRNSTELREKAGIRNIDDKKVEELEEKLIRHEYQNFIDSLPQFVLDEIDWSYETFKKEYLEGL